MAKKLSRILGIVGAVLTITPMIILAVQCMHTVETPNDDPFIQLLAFEVFMLGIIFSPFALLGLIGSLLAIKKPLLGAVLMLVSGVVMLIVLVEWYEKAGPILLIAAGILALIKPKPAALPPEPESDAPQAQF